MSIRQGGMTWVDDVLIAIVLVSVLFGALHGFVRSALGLLVWILAFLAALRYGPWLAASFKPALSSEPLRLALAYAAVFLGVLLVGALVVWLVWIIVRGAGLAPADRMVGCGFGLLRGAFIACAAVMLVGTTSLRQDPGWRHSRLVPRMQPFADALHAAIPRPWFDSLQTLQVAASAAEKK
ncbi:MAG: CvpA family protein [Nevskia sp.]|nr:CvpA family protein [Nevskia sp.]